MTLPEITACISKASPYPLINWRMDRGHILATLGRDMADGGRAEFVFALSLQQLEDAYHPQDIIAAHVKIAADELGVRENSTSALVWMI